MIYNELEAHLQYKMFLLNNKWQGRRKIKFKFTIQNVPIKSHLGLITLVTLKDLQYKMFLLNQVIK